MTIALFAGIRVRDVTAARAWYERLLGEPSFFPNATEVVWTLADDRSLYIQEDRGRAGSALITVLVDDLDGLTAANCGWVASVAHVPISASNGSRAGCGSVKSVRRSRRRAATDRRDSTT